MPTLLSVAALTSPDVAPGLAREVAGCALVLSSEVALDRHGRPYLLLTLRGSAGGRIEARWWRYPYPPDRRPRAGDVCWFSGVVDHYAGEPQLRITGGRRMSALNPDVFAGATRRSLDELQRELAARIAGITDPGLRAVVQTVLSGETYERFCTWPAAHYRHGAVRHGLVAHSLRVATLAEHLAAAYGYGPDATDMLPHDTDVVQTACLLHDVGKTRTLPSIAGAPLPDGAAECDHVTHSVLMVREAAVAVQLVDTDSIDPARLQRLVHAILAHHGLKAWGAPVEPQTVEACLVHLADLAESRLWGWCKEEQK